mgnify:FL=1
MILINMPIPTLEGWSYNFYRRIKLFFQNYNISDLFNNVILYPEFDEVLSQYEYYLPSIIMRGSYKSLDYLYKNKEELKRIRHNIDKIIFLDASQGVDEQLNFMKNEIFFNSLPPIYVMYYLDPSYINNFNNKNDVLEHYYKKALNYDNILVGNKYSIKHFNKYFGYEHFIEGKNAHVVGGCIDNFNLNIKIPRSIFWAGRYNNPTKDFDKFMSIVSDEDFSSYIFYIASPLKDYSILSNYASNFDNLRVVLANNAYEYFKFSSNCKYVLSTSKCETFGYGVFEALSTLTIPIVPDNESSFHILPNVLKYKNKEDILKILNTINIRYDEELYNNLISIINKFSVNSFCERLIYL